MNASKGTSDFTSEFHERTRKLLGERIRQLWVSSGEQQDDFVKDLGISTVTLSNYMNGKRKPDSEFLFAIKKKLNIHLDWLLTGEGPMRCGEALDGAEGFVPAHECGNDADLIMIPRVSARLCAGTGSLETDDNIVGMYAFRAEWILRKGNTKRMVLMDVTGDSMAPDIRHGDIVLVDQSKTDIYGHGYYAVGVEDSIFIKELDMQPGSMILRSLNPRYEDIKVSIGDEHAASVRIIGRVLWVGRELD